VPDAPVLVNAKHAGRFGHRIHDNEIHARDSGITLLRVDDAHVNDNVISWSNGYGILIARDSDRNRVNSNILSSNGSAPDIRLVPDGSFRDAADDAIDLVAFHLFPLFNVVIAGHLYQFPNSEDGQYAGQEDNVVEGNRLTLPGSSAGKSHTGIGVFNNAARSRVTGNTIAGAGTGIRMAGLRPAQPVLRAGRCVNPEGQETPRFCETDADCFIPAIDAAPVGTCPLLVTDVAICKRATRWSRTTRSSDRSTPRRSR